MQRPDLKKRRIQVRYLNVEHFNALEEQNERASSSLFDVKGFAYNKQILNFKNHVKAIYLSTFFY